MADTWGEVFLSGEQGENVGGRAVRLHGSDVSTVVERSSYLVAELYGSGSD